MLLDFQPKTKGIYVCAYMCAYVGVSACDVQLVKRAKVAMKHTSHIQ